MPRSFQLFAWNREGGTSRKLAAIFGLATIFLLAGCGGGGGNQPPEPVKVTISPQLSAAIDQGATQQFTATVTGSSNTGVTWSVQEGAAGGDITAAGLYTAPAKAGTFHVVATSRADSTTSAATVVIVRIVAVSVSPAGLGIDQGATQAFSATVTGTVINTGVTWSVQEGAAGGTITSAGLYTAPAKAGTYHIVAMSQADGATSGTAAVQVPEISVMISPQVAGVVRSGTLQFSATVSGAVEKRVTWSVQEGPEGGSINPDGLYTAPSTLGTFHLVATSVADPSKAATVITMVVDEGFTLVGEMGVSRRDHTATLLASGEVLVAGGSTEVCDPNCRNVPVASAEIFNPATNQFRPTGSMSTARAYHTATLLGDGKVLIVGGEDRERCVSYAATAELYDPVTGSFSPANNLNDARGSHTATLLPDGRVLIAGGETSPTCDPLFTTEIYDPGTQRFTRAQGMGAKRVWHTASLLANGKVLLVGGSFDGWFSLNSVEIFDPASGTFTTAGALADPRDSHSATVLQDGRVLIAGGEMLFGFDEPRTYDNAQNFDAGTGTFGPRLAMNYGRIGHTATLLPTGKVLLTGGWVEGQSAELFDPVTSSFSLTGSLATGRFGHTATLLKDGRVLVVGGSSDKSAEVY